MQHVRDVCHAMLDRPQTGFQEEIGGTFKEESFITIHFLHYDDIT